MKKPQYALLFTTLFFFALILGVYIGRNHYDAYDTISYAADGAGISNVESGSADTAQPQATGRIDINSATKAQLMLLPGIGETLAQRILDYRNANGSFHSTDDLLNVEGIGPVKLESIQPYITVGG